MQQGRQLQINSVTGVLMPAAMSLRWRHNMNNPEIRPIREPASSSISIHVKNVICVKLLKINLFLYFLFTNTYKNICFSIGKYFYMCYYNIVRRQLK